MDMSDEQEDLDYVSSKPILLIEEDDAGLQSDVGGPRSSDNPDSDEEEGSQRSVTYLLSKPQLQDHLPEPHCNRRFSSRPQV